MGEEKVCLHGFVMTVPKEQFVLSDWLEKLKAWLRERKEQEPERELPNLMVLVCEGGTSIRLVHLFLHWQDDERKERVASAVTSFASTLSGLKAAVHCCEVWYVEMGEGEPLKVRPSLHPERKEGVLVVAWEKGKVQVHLAELRNSPDGRKEMSEWQVSEQEKEVGLWTPLWRLLNGEIPQPSEWRFKVERLD